jgi:ferritin-like metal-binding protein YciE
MAMVYRLMVNDSLQQAYKYSLESTLAAEKYLASVGPAAARAHHSDLALALISYVNAAMSRAEHLATALSSNAMEMGQPSDAVFRALLLECEIGDADPVFADSLLTAAMRRVIHCQIANYDTICGLATVLQDTETVETVTAILQEQQELLTKLTAIASSVLYLEQREVNETS